MTDTAEAWANDFRILRSIDKHELVEFDVIDKDDWMAWKTFTSDPLEFIVRADVDRLRKLYKLVQSRRPK